MEIRIRDWMRVRIKLRWRCDEDSKDDANEWSFVDMMVMSLS